MFDYLDGGAEAELTLNENCRAFRDVLFRPRSAVSVGDCDLKTRVLGHELSFPAILAPVGYSRLMHPGGEVAAARAAGALISLGITARALASSTVITPWATSSFSDRSSVAMPSR